MRLFFALWPPPDTAQALAKWAAGIPGKATAAAKIHLTLAFLGEADAAAAIEAAKAVKAPPFELPIEVARFWRHNGIVWVGPREIPQPLQVLAAQLRPADERRPFAAHVTLIRKASEPSVLPPLPAVRWPAEKFVLVRSATGAYQTLAEFPLRPELGSNAL